MSENGMFGVKGSGDTSGFGGIVNTSSNIGVTQRPFGSYFDQIADDLERAYPLFSDAIEKVVVDRGELTLFIGTVFVAYAYVWRRGGLEWD